ncbi:Fe-S oxidoreductase [Longilinea arvoryzae]|uniref:Fe-S oxidoreductase n=1 Tax=Longilinea arvoryzae TaxID=360412 RepID=A0A0S7BD18_9CHLR|nr:radical SAM protein [Longilinea arvoryzae]GAP15791.1 Fe-S oxidoreductase [Longilinea arvoryzae]
MTSILLIYPFFIPRRDRSVFRFPPLGVSYIAAGLKRDGYEVHLIDCTFMEKEEALQKALAVDVDVVGIYCMTSMMEECRWFAKHLRVHCRYLVAGGPLPTCNPDSFLEDFDIVVRGEGEHTMSELMSAIEAGSDLRNIAGIVYRSDPEWPAKGELIRTPARSFIKDLDRIPFPARELLPNESYISYGKKKYGYSITTVMSTRGCPFRCEFCSNVVFGGSYRERSPENVVDEIEAALALGYDRISFADDVFTMKKERTILICQEIKKRGLLFKWECLGRVDAIDYSIALEMKASGCTRIYFGVESGDDQMLELMHKQITSAQARRAVNDAHRAGLQVGAFFILCYPGDTDETVLKTLRFATSLPIDYLGLSMPYPLPGTGLFNRVKNRINRDWHQGESPFSSHVLIFDADFSEAKVWFAIMKGHMQFEIKKRTGKFAPFFLPLFEKPTDVLFKLLK